MSMFFSYLGQVVACVFFVDFLSGFLHWLEDGYLREEWPVLGKWVVQPNIRHHRDPAYFLRHNWLQCSIVPLILGVLVLIAAYRFHFLDWHTWLIVFLGVNANEFHKWAHRSRAKNGRWITFLQSLGILQSPAQHAEHHRGQKNTYYCTLTNYLNPLLEAVRFWAFLEFVLLRLFGIHRRVDDTV